jgi:hypothetical protein
MKPLMHQPPPSERFGVHFTSSDFGKNAFRKSSGLGRISELERLIHSMANMQTSIASRLGCFLVPVVLIGLLIGGWVVYRSSFSPESAVQKAHALWDSNETKNRMAAVAQYRELLQKTDPLDPARQWVRDDRDTLYRRVLVHEFKFEKNERKAHEWIVKAWDEGIRDLRISSATDPEVRDFWDTTIEPFRRKSKIKDKNAVGNRPFEDIPGID